MLFLFSKMATHDKPFSKSFKWLSNKTLRLNLSFHNKKTPKPNTSSPSSSSTQSSPKSPLGKHPTNSNKTTTEQTDELQQVFQRFDGDGDGKISAYELRAYLGSVGEYVSQEDAQAVIDGVDSDGDGFLGFEDFMGMMTRRDADGDDVISGDGGGDLKMAFEMFELEKGCGCITPKGLQRMLNKLGDVRSYGECEAMIRVYDIDGNGLLDFHEFRQMMTA